MNKNSVNKKLILWFKEISIKDVALVGGKNASLGEMFSRLTKKGINIPDGFASTSRAYWYYLKANKIDKKIKEIFSKLNSKNLENLKETSKTARDLILQGEFPNDLKKEILKNYRKLSQKYEMENADVAVRSSATAEDLPGASFAGQHETYLNIRREDELLEAVKKCFSSLFLERAIVYREEKGFEHFKIALSVGVQKMVRSDLATSGIIFTLDTETGFENVVSVNSIWGIGEMIVKGRITPDQFYVFKPTLRQAQGYKPIIVKNLGRKTKKYIFAKEGGLKEIAVPLEKQFKFSLNDQEILQLANWAVLIEEHYGKPQDIEFAKDGRTGELFIVQSRPETIYGQNGEMSYREYEIKTKEQPILTGIAIGNKIGQGRVRVISSISKVSKFEKGDILVTRMTDPDWMPILRMASGIITNEGGRTCHAAIVARELGVPAIVGTKSATNILKTGDMVTLDCTSGSEGKIFKGKIPFKIKKYDLKKIPKLKTKIMVNIGSPDIAFKTSFLPQSGVGLVREEFIIADKIKVHPLALYHFNELKDKNLKNKIERITVGYKNKRDYFIKELAEGVAQIASAFWPKEVIVRFSDFKTNEYRSLIGGELFEGKEENPMLGFRGASRYLDKDFRPAFQMEVQAIKRCRDAFGLKNISVMVPFCRTIKEGKSVVELIKQFGFKGVKIYVMAEIPSNIILADKFLDIFDGMSIGSNDLTQLILGIDRDSGKIAYIGDERDEAVKETIKKVIDICKKRKKYIGICGQAPSDFPDFAEFLMKQGIESISLNPDTIIKTILSLSKNKKV